MRQQILLEPADLTLLRTGQTFTIQLPNGQPFDLVGPNGHNGTALPVEAAKKKKKGKKPKNRALAPTLRDQRGTCPYCKAPNLVLAPHIRHMHAGKPLQWLGPGGVNCQRCKRRFPTPRSLKFHIGHVHLKEATKT